MDGGQGSHTKHRVLWGAMMGLLAFICDGLQNSLMALSPMSNVGCGPNSIMLLKSSYQLALLCLPHWDIAEVAQLSSLHTQNSTVELEKIQRGATE